MRRWRLIRQGWIAGLLTFAIGLLPAQILAAPIFGASPRTQFFLGTALRSFGQFEKASGGGKELKVWTAPAIFSYAVATNATLNLVVPYQRRHLETPTGDFDAEGIGDITLFGKYTFYRRDLPFGRDQLALIGGLELPSGSTSKGPGLKEKRLKEKPSLQLGSGGVDGIVGIAAGTTRSWYSIEGAVRGKINSEAKDFKFGNVLLYDLYLAYQTYPEWPTPPAQLNFSIEFNGRTFADNEGGVDDDTGGTVLFISPGIQYIVTGNLLFETGVQIPIVKDFPSERLEPDFTVLFGFRYLF